MNWKWELGALVPGILAVILLLDLALRFAPAERVTFRAWEAVSRYTPREMAFEPNRRVEIAREYGDLANLGNLPAVRQYRTLTFTTDPRGFRKTVDTPSDPAIAAILVGDSFGVGLGVSDSDTLAAQLGELVGCRVYNASGALGFHWRMVREPERVIALAEELGVKGGLIIDEHVEGIPAPTEVSTAEGIRERLYSASPRHLPALVTKVRGFWAVSPLEILANRALRQLEDDWLLPNTYSQNVTRRTLITGDTMLFTHGEMTAAQRGPVDAIERWVELAAQLERAELKLLVVLVPTKYTVYRSLLTTRESVGSDSNSGLRGIETELRKRRISVLNLTDRLRAEATKDVARGRYLYWLDDTHWNALGIAVAAAEIRQKWLQEGSPLCYHTSGGG